LTGLDVKMGAKHKIKILGAGVSGLTCAINLAKQGFEVEIYEKCSRIGEHYKENPQMLPNWFTKQDVIEEMKECGIKVNWKNRINQVEIYLKNQRVVIYGKDRAVGYTVLRGGERSFERDLEEQARAVGVKIITDFKGDIRADVIATGVSKILTVGYGQVFKGSFDAEKVKVVFNLEWCPSVGYCYFFPHDRNTVTIKTSKTLKDKEVDVKKNLEEFKAEYLGEQIKQENFLYDFGTKRSFYIPKTAKTKNGALILGEAAGFQDELFRFGMRYAVISGFLAARSIIDDLNYDKLWKTRFMREFKRTARVQRIFTEFKRKGMSSIPDNLNIHIEIERFKKIWLSPAFYLGISLFPVYRGFIFNDRAIRVIVACFTRLNLFDKDQA